MNELPTLECSICSEGCEINEVDGHYDYHVQLNKMLDEEEEAQNG